MALCLTSHGRNGILFIGRCLASRKTEETDLLRSKQGPVNREGCGVPQNGGNIIVLERYGRNGGPVHREGCGVPQNGAPRDTVHLHRRPPPASTSYCSSTVDLFQPPPVTVHPRAPVHPASTACYSIGYCSTTPPPSTVHPALHPSGACSTTPPRAPLHRLLFIQPSTPRGPVQPPLHGHPSTVYCSSSPPHHGVLFIQRQRHRSLFIQPPLPQRSLFIQSIGFS